MAETAPLAGFAPPGGVEIELCPAKISDRFVAYFLDLIPFLGGFSASLYVILVKLQAAPAGQTVGRVAALWTGLLLLYQFVGNLRGGTVGKRLMGLRVVRRDGGAPLGFARSLVRAVGYLLSTPLFNFGFLVALAHPESRALHDLLSGALVVEARARNAAEAVVLFLAAVCVAAGLFFGDIYFTLNRPYPSDLLAVQKAREGLRILARIEESYQAKNGSYTKSLSDLAEASGDAEEFKKAMLELFDPNLFRLEAGMGKYRISAAARDRHRTRVSITGPLAASAP